MRAHGAGKSEARGGIVIDGFDDAANALQGSGVSKQLAAALQAFVFYPLILPLVNLGATGTRAELKESREAYEESKDELRKAREQILEALKDVPGAQEALRKEGLTEHQWRLAVVDALNKVSDRNARNLCLYEIAHYDEICREHGPIELKYRGAPAALIGAHAMLGGVLLYHASAVVQFSAITAGDAGALAAMGTSTVQGGSILSSFSAGIGAQAAVSVLALSGHLVMFGGQAAMAIYGGIAMAGGIKAHKALSAERKIIEEAPKHLMSDGARKDLLAQNSTQKKLNWWGRIFANGALSVGQVLMLLGGAIVGLGLPLLVVGAIITIGAIVTRLVMEKLNSKRFSYDPAAFARVCKDKSFKAETPEEAAKAIEVLRKRFLIERAWISVIEKLDAVKRSHPNASREELSELLKAKLDKLHTDSHETQLREAVEDIQKNYQHVLTLCLLSKTKGLTAFVALQAQQSDEPPRADQLVTRILDFEVMSPGKRMKTVLALQGLGDEWQRRTVQKLVVGNAGKNNLRGSGYRGYITAKDEGVREEVCETTRHFLARGIWTKKKTTYSFNSDALIRSLEQSQLGLSGEVENIVYAAVDKTIRKESAYQARSRLFGANHLLSQVCAASGIRTKLEKPEAKSEGAMGPQPEPEHHGMIVRVPTEPATHEPLRPRMVT